MAMSFPKKIIYSLSLDGRWACLDGISYREKIRYIFSKYINLFFNRKSINYLGEKFSYDNRATPATLQSYPYEIKFLDEFMNLNSARNILDIGANIGQFSRTISTLFPHLKVFSFEPNPVIFETLQNNVRHLPVQCINCGVSPKSSSTLFFVPGYSGKGSFISENAVINLGDMDSEEVKVQSILLDESAVERFDLPPVFDLVKIDVEGFEYEVLESLPALTCRFLYVEISLARSHGYDFPELLSRIQSKFGKFTVLYCDGIDARKSGQTIGSLLVKVEDV